VGENLAIVALGGDGVAGPGLRQAQHGTEVAFLAQQPANLGIARPLGPLADAGLGEAQLLGQDQGVQGPAHHRGPGLVAPLDHRPQRFLGDDVRQDGVLFRIRQGGPRRRQGRDVGAQGVAILAPIGLARRLLVGQDHRPVFDAARPEPVGDVQLRGRARLDTDPRAVQLGGAGQVQGAADQEALAVVVVGPGEPHPLPGLARQGPGGGAPQHVDAAGAQGLEPLAAGDGHEAHLVAVPQHGGGQRAAEVNVEAAPLAAIVGVGEADQPFVDAAVQPAASLDRRQRRTGETGGGRRGTGRGGVRALSGVRRALAPAAASQGQQRRGQDAEPSDHTLDHAHPRRFESQTLRPASFRGL
jgi:hypothetical protein